MPIAPSLEILYAIKGMLVIFTFGVRTLDWSREPIQCVQCGKKKHDYSDLYLNDNSS